MAWVKEAVYVIYAFFKEDCYSSMIILKPLILAAFRMRN